MVTEKTFIKAVDPVGVMKNALYIVGGLVVAYLGYANMVTIRLGSLRLPGWSMYIFASILIGAGVLLVLFSLFQEKCAKCHTNSEFEELHFSPSLQDDLLQAVSSFTLTGMNPQFVGGSSKNVTLSLRYCPSCQKSAEVSLTAYGESQASSKELLPQTVVPEQHIAALIEYVEQYVVGD